MRSSIHRFTIALLLAVLAVQPSWAQSREHVNTVEYQEQKAAGKLPQPEAETSEAVNYPQLIDSRSMDVIGSEGSRDMTTRTTIVIIPPEPSCPIYNPAYQKGYTELYVNDDGSSPAINLPFTFDLFGKKYAKVYVNNNGNLTFDRSLSSFTSSGFPSYYSMVAPFWADVDTRGTNNGRVYYKVSAHRFEAVWYRVGFYNSNTSKLNTFKVIITDGTDAEIGIGNNVAFQYGDMQWTTGDASSGYNGLGGTPASVGMSLGNSQGDCFFFQLGRFNKTGTEYLGPQTSSGVDYLDNKCFAFNASLIENVAADFTYAQNVCATIFTPQIDNSQNCSVTDYAWDFGDGNTSTEPSPVHEYRTFGTYTVTLDINYECGACTSSSTSISKEITLVPEEDIVKDTTFLVTTQLKKDVLAASVTTYKSLWEHDDLPERIADQPGYLNAQQGVWRAEGSYAYNVERTYSDNTSVRSDGTFTLEQYNQWDQASLDVVPNWVKANTISAYNAQGFETENRNALGIPSAALYGYGGYLPMATGVNARQNEMAYTGFEAQYRIENEGNWLIGNPGTPAINKTYPTQVNNGHKILVPASLEDLEEFDYADVSGFNFAAFGFIVIPMEYRYLANSEIVCRQRHPDNPEWSVLIMRTPLFEGYWQGHIRLRKSSEPGETAEVDDQVAHTGKSSLRVSTIKVFKQPYIQPDPDKTYRVSAWVSVNDPSLMKPIVSQSATIRVQFKNKEGVVTHAESLQLTGPVIEGWQQLSGSIVRPPGDLTMEIVFVPDRDRETWFDDLRFQPEQSSMSSYVYNLKDYRLSATLDENNFATFYYYDQEGNLYLTKRETEEGIITLQENTTYQVQR